VNDLVRCLSQKHELFIFRELAILLSGESHVMASELVVSSQLMTSEFITFSSRSDQPGLQLSPLPRVSELLLALLIHLIVRVP